jgi:HEAT repeat protein
MIGIFNQAEAGSAVAGLLKHSSFQVKLNAIQTLTKLEAGEYINRLFNMIDIQDDNIKVATIKAFEKLGSEYHKNLLKPFLLDNSYQVRLAAAKALKGTRINHNKLLDAQAQARQEEILNHATDPNL